MGTRGVSGLKSKLSKYSGFAIKSGIVFLVCFLIAFFLIDKLNLKSGGSMNYSSQITFLYFEKIDEAKHFFGEVLELEEVFNPGPAIVWRTGIDSFVGAVDASRGSIEVKSRGGVLVSLTVKDLDKWYEKIKKHNPEGLTEPGSVEWAGLKSFFFKGPEGYDFEIQEFIKPELRELF